MLNIILLASIILAAAAIVGVIIRHNANARQGIAPNEDASRKPFLDSDGNHSYYDRKLNR